MENEESKIEDRQSAMPSCRIEFIKFSGCCFMQNDIVWPSHGDWQVLFFATLKAVPACGIFRQRLNVARQWRFAESIGDKKAMLAELKKRAEICGFEKLEIFSVSRIEVVGFGLN